MLDKIAAWAIRIGHSMIPWNSSPRSKTGAGRGLESRDFLKFVLTFLLFFQFIKSASLFVVFFHEPEDACDIFDHS
jgi:hypothetical protein